MCFFQFSVIVETSEIEILEKGLTLLHRFGISLHEMVIRHAFGFLVRWYIMV